MKPRGKANDEGVAGLGAKFTGSTHTAIGLSALLMSLIVERGQVPTRHSVDTHVAADFLCMLRVQKPASGSEFEPLATQPVFLTQPGVSLGAHIQCLPVVVFFFPQGE